MFGPAVPNHWSAGIAIHFAHRLGAVIVASAAIATAVAIWRRHRDRAELAVPAGLLVIVVAAQIALGASAVLTGLQPWVNSLHVVTGASVLATSLVIALPSWQSRLPGWRVHAWRTCRSCAASAGRRSPAIEKSSSSASKSRSMPSRRPVTAVDAAASHHRGSPAIESRPPGTVPGAHDTRP